MVRDHWLRHPHYLCYPGAIGGPGGTGSTGGAGGRGEGFTLSGHNFNITHMHGGVTMVCRLLLCLSTKELSAHPQSESFSAVNTWRENGS